MICVVFYFVQNSLMDKQWVKKMCFNWDLLIVNSALETKNAVYA